MRGHDYAGRHRLSGNPLGTAANRCDRLIDRTLLYMYIERHDPLRVIVRVNSQAQRRSIRLHHARLSRVESLAAAFRVELLGLSSRYLSNNK